MPRPFLFLVFLLVSQSSIFAQQQQAGSGRKTIEITATEKVVVAADVATVKIGYHNLSTTKDAAYAENARAAIKIVQAVLDAGVPKEAIETESLKLEQEQERYGTKPDQPSKYVASQEWQIRSLATEAQKIVDIAVAARRNHLDRQFGKFVRPVPPAGRRTRIRNGCSAKNSYAQTATR
jgi:uncharacterized protein YggE